MVGGAVVAVDFADVFAVGDFTGKGFRVVAGVGGKRIGGAEQAGIVHEGVCGAVVDAETEGMGTQLDTFAFPPDVGTAVGGDAEIVVVLDGKGALAPAGLDRCLCKDDYRIDPEGEGEEIRFASFFSSNFKELFSDGI